MLRLYARYYRLDDACRVQSNLLNLSPSSAKTKRLVDRAEAAYILFVDERSALLERGYAMKDLLDMTNTAASRMYRHTDRMLQLRWYNRR